MRRVGSPTGSPASFRNASRSKRRPSRRGWAPSSVPTGTHAGVAIAATPGDLLTWSSQWATDTIHSAAPAFAHLAFSDEDAQSHWAVDLPDGYAKARTTLQRAQLLKGGARLAAVLRAIWP